jgi:hypothetical protein
LVGIEKRYGISAALLPWSHYIFEIAGRPNEWLGFD